MANFALNYSFSRNLNIPLDEDAVKTSLSEVVSYVQTKSKCYAGQLFSVTGDTETQPMTMGGGTYAKGINNTIAFGGAFPNAENCHMHDANEFIVIEDLLKQTEVYVQAILNILAL